MSRITIRKAHTMDTEQIRQMVTELAERLSQRFDAQSRWIDDNTVSVKHSRMSGELSIGDGVITIDIRLGMLAGAFKGKIEAELRKELDQRLS